MSSSIHQMWPLLLAVAGGNVLMKCCVSNTAYTLHIYKYAYLAYLA
jgi:hypothetical protein